MPRLIRPPDKRDATTFLRMLFLRTEQRLIAEIRRKRINGYVDYAETAALKRTQQILRDMVDESFAYVPTMIETIFYRSEAAANGYDNAAGLTAVQMDMVRQLSDNLLGDIVEASTMAQGSMGEILQVGRQETGRLRTAALSNIVEQSAAGHGSRNAANGMASQLRQEGITAFVDKTGRKWSLQDYCNMATRTTARQAEVSAILMADPDHDLYKIVRIGSTCPICAPLEGRVYSRSGTDPDYPALAQAFGKIDPSGTDDLSNTYLNIHPNCLHSLVKYTTMGKTDKQIQKDKDFSNFEKNPVTVDPRTKKQIEAYKEKVKNRQKLLNDYRQHQKYLEILGGEVPKDFESFWNMKYNKTEAWKQMQAAYRKTNAYNKIIAKEPAITQDLKAISEETGVKMTGLEHRLKTKESFLRKVNAGSGDVLDVIASTGDIIRYTYMDSPASLAASCQEIMRSMQEKGYSTIKVKNFWINKRDPYNGINCTFKTQEGQRFEVQFHTPESYNVKDGMHKDYEAWRILDPTSEKAKTIRKKMMEQSQGMEVPAYIEEIKNQ